MMRHWIWSALQLPLLIVMISGTSIPATAYPHKEACYLFDDPEPTLEACGHYAGAILGEGTEVSGGLLHIGDNGQDYACLDNAILDGATDFTLTLRFTLDTVKSRNTIIYLMGAGDAVEMALHVEGTLKLYLHNPQNLWVDTGLTISPGESYEIEAMRLGSTFWLYVNDQFIWDGDAVDTSPLVIGDVTLGGGVTVGGVLLGQDPCTSCSYAFGQGASLAGTIDYVFFYRQAPVAVENMSLGHLKSMYR